MILAHLAGTFAPLQLAPATLASILYAIRANTLRRTPREVPAWRQYCFHGGVLLILVTLVSPIGHVSDELFSVHMAEHLLLGDLAPLLLVLGLTAPVLAPVLKIRLFDRLRVLAHPAVALPLWAIDFYTWHIPSLADSAVRHQGVHALMHTCFIVFGANVWMALFGPLPKPAWFGNGWKCGYILAVRLLGAVLGNVLVFGGGHFYDVYARGERYWHISPASDQVTAGAIMMVWESFLTLGLFCWLFLRAATEGEQRQALLDLANARGVELSDRRAAIAVAAGRGEDLRIRIEQTGHTPQGAER